MEGMLDQLGCMKYILKSDQEPASVELNESWKRGRDDDIIMEESPVEDSRSHGYVERAVQTVQGQVRTLKSALEGRMGGGSKTRPSRFAVAGDALRKPAQQV